MKTDQVFHNNVRAEVFSRRTQWSNDAERRWSGQ